ncbi:uncharacterized protein BDR25DRAFT_314746 [Lindgomyces ingoldianus]|uniref:Uncharacterized protein n=1 Tax=Lindgomyces ingoldianus TaxID=673940 RepID=A0ACB6QTX5_9PLEO|nr:uncharacterized protein BDR25DRAFT_314746 [Lindgomyces ingoldianus]KAF2469975.1 hypothetical protein BDR25DRAFT_314746 [Lindgomyces ingoldianus]
MKLSLLSPITALLTLVSTSALPAVEVNMVTREPGVSDIVKRASTVDITYCSEVNYVGCQHRSSGHGDCAPIAAARGRLGVGMGFEFYPTSPEIPGPSTRGPCISITTLDRISI